MRIRKGSELENMGNISDARLRFLYVATQNPTNDRQRFIYNRVKGEVYRRVKDAASFEI